MNSWQSYPKIYSVAHRQAKDLLGKQVVFEEKVDGSQFSFGVTENNELLCRSKGKEIDLDAPDKMFMKAVETAKSLHESGKLTKTYTYRCEYLQKSRHNVLEYSRIPNNHLYLFDISTGEQDYVIDWQLKAQIAKEMGLEPVNVMAEGLIDPGLIRELLEQESCLGGPKIEGVVIKPRNYNIYGTDKKVVFAKHVNEAFKESHREQSKIEGKSIQAVVLELCQATATPARWNKAIQFMRETIELENSPKDIGALVKHLQADTIVEEKDIILDAIWPMIESVLRKSVTRGFPEYYKQTLLDRVFAESDDNETT